MATLTTHYLESSRIPVKSVSTSTLSGSLLPRPTKTSSRTLNNTTTTTTIKQRATTTPRVHRRRTSSSSSSSSSLSNNWLTSIFSQQAKNRFKSAIRLYVDKEDPHWQVNEDTMRYMGTKNTKKFEFGRLFLQENCMVIY